MDVERKDDFLYFSSDSRLHKIDLNDSTTYVNDSTNEVVLTDYNGESVSYFELNDTHLVVSYQNLMQIFKIENDEFIELTTKTINITNGTNVAINNNGQIFFINEQGLLCKINAQTPNSIPIPYDNVSASKIIANNKNVFFLNNGSLHSLSIETGETIDIPFSTIDKNYDLGYNTIPNALSFKGENLLISDTGSNTVQEFKIENGELVFTGFAIAKGKTAYNRVNGATTKIKTEKCGDLVAVLDDYKLTVINTANANKYDRDNYKNFFIENLTNNGNYPENFALGNNSAILSYNLGTQNSAIRVLNLTSGTLSDKITFAGNSIIRDVYYQSGNFYALADNGSAPQHVFKASESNLIFAQIDQNSSQTDYSSLAIDVYANVYLYNSTSVAKLDKANGYSSAVEILNGLSAVKKILTDLSGGIYILDNGQIKYSFDGQIKDTFEFTDKTVSALAMDYIDTATYVVFTGEEHISKTQDLQNIAFDKLTVPQDFILQAQTADVQNLKAYKPNSLANVYSIVKTENGFNFNGLISLPTAYISICTVEQSNGYGAAVSFYALASANGIVFIDEKEAVEEQIELTAIESGKSAFTTTDVDGYYLPLITENDDYQLVNGNGQKVTLEKATRFTPLYSFTYLADEYYYAEITVDGNTVNCYIPKAFTVEVLSEDFKWEEFTVEQISKTKVYAEKEMSTVIKQLADGAKVRVMEKGSSVCKIAYYDQDNGWITGYIKTSAIKDEPSRAVRNILIILAVAACVCGTTTYFILRKKVK